MSLAPPTWPPPHLVRPAKRGWPWWKIVPVALIPLAVTLAIAAVFTDGDDEGVAVDPQDAAACNSFRSAAGDYSDGVLTLGELRVRFQDVEDEAQGATGPVVHAAREMLAAITSDIEELPAAIDAMDRACDQIG